MKKTRKLLNTAFALSIVTIVYNLVEGLISVYFGLEDDTLALLGFGADSFVEVLSGLGIAHMIARMKLSDVSRRDSFERTALRITGVSFYLLVAGILFGAVFNIINGTKPDTTIVGVVVSTISIMTMWILMSYKLKVGKLLNSEAIISDANCTKTCFYLSIILLVSSGLYELFGLSYIDIAGSLGIAYYAFKEGREAFEKARNNNLSCGCDDDACSTDKKDMISIDGLN